MKIFIKQLLIVRLYKENSDLIFCAQKLLYLIKYIFDTTQIELSGLWLLGVQIQR